MPAVKSSVELKSEVHFVRTQVKEMITPGDITKVFESDFIDKTSEEVSMSQEDIKFLARIKEGIKQKPNGHYEMPLPFKEERPNLPNNKAYAENLLKCLEKRLTKNEQYHKDYVAFMEDMIERDDAEWGSRDECEQSDNMVYPSPWSLSSPKAGKDASCL